MSDSGMHEAGRLDRIAGTLLGQAYGDALGSPYEFRRPPARGKARFGWGTFGHAPAAWTDDTEQAVCVARARSEPGGVAANLLGWYRSGPQDIGSTTAAVLGRVPQRGTSAPGTDMLAVSRAYAQRQAATPKPAGYDEGGSNGSLMRTGPVCLPYLGDRQRVAQAARKVSDLTHADRYCGDAAVIWSLAVAEAVELGGKFTAPLVVDGLEFVPASRHRFWAGVIAEALSGPQPSSQNGSAVGALRCALYAVSRAGGLEDGLQLACHLGGDTDTVAAIAGALLGARFGASAVPDALREQLHGWPGMKAGDLEALALSAAGLEVPA